VTLIAYTPLANGLNRKNTEMDEYSVAQVALNWLIHFSGDILVSIPGATKSYQAQDSVVELKLIQP